MKPKLHIPRAQKVTLPHGGLPEIISLHLLKLIEKTGGAMGPIGLQFVAQPGLEKKWFGAIDSDPLNEDEFEVAPGMVYKYRGKVNKNGKVTQYGRVLWTVTRFCSAYCRFCTRGREVGASAATTLTTNAALAKQPFLSEEQISEGFAYLQKHPEINEVVLSGGDPLTAPQAYLTRIITGLAELQKKNRLHIVRLGTRLPVSNPISIKPWHATLLSKLVNPYVMVHINHPAELTEETLAALTQFRRVALATVMSQTVFLAGVNDSVETLQELFVELAKNGIRPYYLFQCDPVYWAKHLTVPFGKALRIWEQLRPRLSGVAATARFVIDVPHGAGKVPVPEGNAWKIDYGSYTDFNGAEHKSPER